MYDGEEDVERDEEESEVYVGGEVGGGGGED